VERKENPPFVNEFPHSHIKGIVELIYKVGGELEPIKKQRTNTSGKK